MYSSNEAKCLHTKCRMLCVTGSILDMETEYNKYLGNLWFFSVSPQKITIAPPTLSRKLTSSFSQYITYVGLLALLGLHAGFCTTLDCQAVLET